MKGELFQSGYITFIVLGTSSNQIFCDYGRGGADIRDSYKLRDALPVLTYCEAFLTGRPCNGLLWYGVVASKIALG